MKEQGSLRAQTPYFIVFLSGDMLAVSVAVLGSIQLVLSLLGR